MTDLIHRRFRFPDKCNLRSAVLRETNGIDEKQAALASDVGGPGTSIFQELIKLSIVEVDDEKAVQPLNAIEGWNSKTRALLVRAYEQLNDLQDEEIAVFLAASEDATPGLAVVEPEAPPVAKKRRGGSQNTGS